MLWLIRASSKSTGKFWYIVELGFESKAAAEYWIEKQGDDMTRYEPFSTGYFDLKAAKEIWP